MQNLLWIITLFLQIHTAAVDQPKSLGFIHESMLSPDLYVAGMEQERMATSAAEGQLVYINGPALSSVRVGDTYSVLRPELNVTDPLTYRHVGTYYRELGTVQVRTATHASATALVTLSCDIIRKGDLLVPPARRPAVNFSGVLSNRLTPIPEQGLIAPIILGQGGLRELAQGQYCFIAAGARDGVKPGERFTVYRPQPVFNPREITAGMRAGYSMSEGIVDGAYREQLVDLLSHRSLPPKVLGDVLILDIGETTSLAMIINSLEEVHLGDLVIRR